MRADSVAAKHQQTELMETKTIAILGRCIRRPTDIQTIDTGPPISYSTVGDSDLPVYNDHLAIFQRASDESTERRTRMTT